MKKKLALHKETLRMLQDEALLRAAGGRVSTGGCTNEDPPLCVSDGGTCSCPPFA